MKKNNEKETERCYFSYSPAGRLKTPAPTIFLTKLKISFGMVAVPPPEAPPETSNVALDADILRDFETGVDFCCTEVENPPRGTIRKDLGAA